ncbi:MAG: imidazolonepropionase [Verrucomicrobia bacterium]|nr:MAG: imidazolonepropionase [Verrucomicrobiota bacterium]TMP91295.1 MAG: imidazolonepropionase [Verrucomicrobiota bacterium]
MPSIALLHASQLVTLAGPPRARRGKELSELGIISDGAFVAAGGKITHVGKSTEIEKLCDGETEVIDARGCIVLPGFVDAHTHLVFAGNRLDDFEARARGETYEQIAKRGGGIQTTVRATRAASEDELCALAKRRASWFLRNGTTMVEAKSGYGLTLEDELKILRVIQRVGKETPLETVPTFLGAHAVPAEFREDRAGYISLIIEEMLPRIARERLAEYCDIFCERDYFDVEDVRRILTAAKQHGLKLRMHVDQLTNGGGAKLAAELGATTADHLEQTAADGISALAKANIQPVLLPGSVYALGSKKYPDARAMIDAGLAVIVATDFNPGSSPSPSMPMMLSLAVTQMRMSPTEAVTAATVNAAASLNRMDEIGSLEVGKLANFAICDCEDYRELAYWFGGSLVRHVFVRGVSVSRNGGFQTADA